MDEEYLEGLTMTHVATYVTPAIVFGSKRFRRTAEALAEARKCSFEEAAGFVRAFLTDPATLPQDSQNG